MKLFDYFKIAFIALRTNKTRSLLAMLGIVIGIASVITMISIGSGAQNLIIKQVISFGSNNIFIEPGAWSKRMEKGSLMQTALEELEIKTLTAEDAKAIAKEPTIEMTAPFVMGVERVVYREASKKVTFMGTTPETSQITDTQVILGRDITDQDIKSVARVVVLGYELRKDLFAQEHPIGKIVRIKKTNFRVIGVSEEKGMQMFMNLDEGLSLPITTAQKLLLGTNYVRWIIAKAESKEVIEQAVHDIRLLLRERHGIYNPEGDLAKDDFKVVSQTETAEMLGTVTSVFTIFLSVIAAIALVVGGIGIMNIMLVSVTERTQEIGLRKAVGARKKDILYQFLIEAVTLTLAGGVIGIIFGISGSFLGGVIIGKMLSLNWDFILSFKAIILAFGVSTVIGVGFGIYPARKAAQLSPIDALRYE